MITNRIRISRYNCRKSLLTRVNISQNIPPNISAKILLNTKSHRNQEPVHVDCYEPFPADHQRALLFGSQRGHQGEQQSYNVKYKQKRRLYFAYISINFIHDSVSN